MGEIRQIEEQRPKNRISRKDASKNFVIVVGEGVLWIGVRGNPSLDIGRAFYQYDFEGMPPTILWRTRGPAKQDQGELQRGNL